MNTFVVEDQSGQIKVVYGLRGDEEGEGRSTPNHIGIQGFLLAH